MRIRRFIYKSSLSFLVLLSPLLAKSQLTGTKTIDPSGSGTNNYVTFSQAIHDLNAQGVGPGGVTFNVAAGSTFNERLPILYVSGTATRPIVFRRNGSGPNPVVAPITGGIVTTKAVNTNGDGIIRIAYSDYLTFDGIDARSYGSFASDSTRYEYGYILFRSASNACKNVTIRNANITLDSSYIYTTGIFLSKLDTNGVAVTVNANGGRMENINIVKNVISWTNNGIYSYGGTSTSSLYDNNIRVDSNYINRFGGGSTTAYGFYIIYSANTRAHANTIVSDSAQSSSLYGIYFSTATNATTEISYNTLRIRGNSSTYGVYHSAGASGNGNSAHVHHNYLTNDLLSNSSSSSYYGFYLTTTTENLLFHDNRIDSIRLAGTGTLYAYYHSTPANSRVYNNVIRNITRTGSGTFYGFYMANGGNNIVYNNRISELYAPANSSVDGLRGIYLVSGTTKLYHNTVYLDASSSAAGFGSVAIYAAITVNLEMANNIFMNVSTPGSTGMTVAYKRSANSFNNFSEKSDRNIYYAGTPSATRVIYTDGTETAVTIQNYKALAGMGQRDLYSVSGTEPFVNVSSRPYDLNIQTSAGSQAESLGLPVTVLSISTDAVGNTRGSRPDAGAYEGSFTRRDVTAPGIGYTALSNVASTSNRTFSNVVIRDISGVNVSAANKPRLYYKKKTDANTYAGNNSSDNGWKYVLANNNSSPFNFTIDYSKLFGGGSLGIGDTIEYFLIAQDSATTPNVGYSPVTLNSVPSSVNLAASNFPASNIRNYYTFRTGISGIVNVGAGQSYLTLTRDSGLFQAINNAVLSGDLTVNITSDILNENGVHGLNEFSQDDPGGFRIIIQPSAAASRTIAGTFAGGLIRLNGVERVTIDGRFGGSGNYLTFQQNSTSTNTAAIQIIGSDITSQKGSSNVVIRNTNIRGGSNTVTSAYGLYIGTTGITTSATGVDNDNISVLNNNFFRAYIALYARGNATTGPYDSLLVQGNTLGSFTAADYLGSRGMYLSGMNEATISDNRIFNVRLTSTVHPAGIELTDGAVNSVIKNNRIHDIHSRSTGTSGGASGIYITGGQNLTLMNNVIYRVISFTTANNLTSTTNNPFGIRITDGDGIKLYYNSIWLSDSMPGPAANVGSSAALLVSSTGVTGLDIRNNIFANSVVRTGSGSKAYAVWFASGYDFTDAIIDYNGYFVPGTNKTTTSYFVGREGTTVDYTKLGDWRNFSGQDAKSQPPVNSLPGFTNDSTLIIPGGILSRAESTGQLISGISNKDILGNDRPKGTGIGPDLGAYEFEGIPGDFFAPVIDSFRLNLSSNQCVPTARNISVYVSDIGGTGTDTVWVNYSINNVSQPRIRLSLSSGTVTSGVWTGTIPATPGRNQLLTFSINARDTADNFSEETSDSSYKDAYLVVDAGPNRIINVNTKARLIATKNMSGTVSWSPGSSNGDTLITAVLNDTTIFYATITDGVCSFTDSVFVFTIPPVVPNADFSADFTTANTLQTVSLTDLSTNIPDFWEWRISPSNYIFVEGTDNTSQNPKVKFTREGKYTIELVAYNAAGRDSVTKTEYIEVNRVYCNIFSSDPNGRENITSIKLDNLVINDTAARQFFSFVDLTADSAKKVTLTRNKYYTLNVKSGGTRTATIAAFIDYNLNGLLDDSGEKLAEVGNVDPGDSINISFTTPANLEQGLSRLRIRLIYGNANIVPCANYTDEETVDLLLNFCNLTANPIISSVDFCGGDSVVLDALNSGSNFDWSNGANSQVITLMNAGLYTLEVNNGYCAIRDTITVNIKAGFGGSNLVPATVFNGKAGNGNITVPDSVCAGTALNFDLVPPGSYGNSGFGTQWFFFAAPLETSGGAGVNGALISNAPFGSNNARISFIPAMNDADSIVAIRLRFLNLISGCDTSIVRYVKVLPLSVPALASDTGICPGASVTLDAGTGQSFVWSSGQSTQTINVSNSGRYKVTVTNSVGCSASDSILVYFLPKPNPAFSYQNNGNNTVSFNPITKSGVNHAWNFGDGEFSNDSTPTHDFDSTGNYTIRLIVTDVNSGCTDSSLQVLNFTRVGIDDIALEGKEILVYPNPFNEQSHVKFTLLKPADVQIELYDISGKLLGTVQNGKLSDGTHLFNFGDNIPSSGIYFLKVKVNESVSTVKILKAQ